MVSKIQCGPISNNSYAIVVERARVLFCGRWICCGNEDKSDDDAIEDESTRILGSNDCTSVRLLAWQDHTETRINTISLFPIKVVTVKTMAQVLRVETKEGGLIVYKYGRSLTEGTK